MKIQIQDKPPDDIFKNRKAFTYAFIFFLALAFMGVLMGVYAIFAETKYYENLETAALSFFFGSSLCISYVGEKLQNYKKLTPPQAKELVELYEKHAAVKSYCNHVAQADRSILRVEFEACQTFAQQEEKKNGN